MGSRLDFNAVLKTIPGNPHVYFQPPEGTKLVYPAIVYKRSNIDNEFANNNVYKQDRQYDVTVIDSDPDSTIVDHVSKLPRCRFNRHFVSDKLNHDVFVIYY